MKTKTDTDFSWFDIRNYDVSDYLEGESENSAVYKVLMRHLGISLEMRDSILHGQNAAEGIIKSEIFDHQNPLLLKKRKNGTDSKCHTTPPIDDFISGLKTIATPTNPRYSRIINPLYPFDIYNILAELRNSPKSAIDEAESVDVNEQYQKTYPNKVIFLKVDLKANKKSIMDEFEKFIDKQQEIHSCRPKHQNKNTASPQNLFNRFKGNYTLACIDLLMFQPTLTKAELGRLLLNKFNSSSSNDIEKIDKILSLKEKALDQNVYNQLIQG